MQSARPALAVLTAALAGCSGTGLSTNPSASSTGNATSGSASGSSSGTTASANTTSGGPTGGSTGTSTSSGAASCAALPAPGDGGPTYTRLFAGTSAPSNALVQLLPAGSTPTFPTDDYPDAITAGPGGAVWFHVNGGGLYELLADGGIQSQPEPQDVISVESVGGLAVAALGSTTTLEAFNLGTTPEGADIEGFSSSTTSLWATNSQSLTYDYLDFVPSQLLPVPGGILAGGAGIGYVWIAGFDGTLCGELGTPVGLSYQGAFQGIAQGPDGTLYGTGVDGNGNGLIAAESIGNGCLWELTGGTCGSEDTLAQCPVGRCTTNLALTGLALGQAAFVSGTLYVTGNSSPESQPSSLYALNPATRAFSTYLTDRNYVSLAGAP